MKEISQEDGYTFQKSRNEYPDQLQAGLVMSISAEYSVIKTLEIFVVKLKLKYRTPLMKGEMFTKSTLGTCQISIATVC